MCTPQLLADRYLDVITHRLGLPAQIDEGHDITFRTAGATWLLQNNAPADPEYLHLLLLSTIPENASGELVDRLALEATINTKVVKAFRRNNTLWLSAEMLIAPPDQLPAPEHLAAVLPRTIRLVLAAVEKIHDGIALQQILDTPITTGDDITK